MASIGTIALTGKSGTAYQFNIYPRSAKFAAVGVAYVMAKQNGNNYILIYIGQTGDASQRPFNHHRKDCFDRHGVDHVLIRAENDEKTRVTVETDLRQTYDPPCNRQ
jgi:predicted GIY-YIG superfamily endonuclease